MAVDYDTELILVEKYKAQCTYDPYVGSLFCIIETKRLDDVKDFLNTLGYQFSVFTDKEITFVEIWDEGGQYEVVFVPEGEE